MPANTTMWSGEGNPIADGSDANGKTVASDLLDLVNLSRLMELTSGRPEIAIGLIDGPVVTSHPDLSGANVREIGGGIGDGRTQATSFASMHGTFVAGILSAERTSSAPAICPDCALLVRPIFPGTASGNERIPGATPHELATAIIECIDAGARLVNLSAALVQVPSAKDERMLSEALDFAAMRGVIVVAAAGNQGSVGSTIITRHPAVIAVIACDRRGRPLHLSNLGSSIGRRGLSAPGQGVTSLSIDGRVVPSGGTSVAAPFVTGALALVWSISPDASASRLRLAVAQAHGLRPRTVVPALLDAWATHTAMRTV